jgi:hypothetical protein
MSAQNSDRRPPIIKRSMTECEHEQDTDDNQLHVLSTSNPGIFLANCSSMND